MKEIGSRLHAFAKARLLSVGIIAVVVAGFVTATATGQQKVPGSQLPTLSSGAVGAQAVAIPALPASPSVVLYDQFVGASTTGAIDVTSQDFESVLACFSGQAADDFVVPAGQTWSITEVDVLGEYSVGPADSFHVFFYANDPITNLPGALVASRPLNPYTGSSTFLITLTSPVTLCPGHYWVSVQARQNFTPNGQWFWHNSDILSNNPAVWQNPGGCFGTTCTTWNLKTTCLGPDFHPDQIFRLIGTADFGVDPADLTNFRGVRRASDITSGFDLCTTVYPAMKFRGSTGSAGDTWITVYDETPVDDTVKNIYDGCLSLSADVQIKPFNNRKGAGLLAKFNEGPTDKGLALIIYDNGNTDGLTLGTVSKSSNKVTALAPTVFLDSGIKECDWYRLTMDVVVSGGNVTVTGNVFKLTAPFDLLPGPLVGTLSFSGPLPPGVSATGEVGMVASAISAVVDSSVTNFKISF